MTHSAATISTAGASPSAIRAGMVIGALNGMNDGHVGERAVGVVEHREREKNEIRISIVSGVVEAWSSSWRGTSAPAAANRPE